MVVALYDTYIFEEMLSCQIAQNKSLASFRLTIVELRKIPIEFSITKIGSSHAELPINKKYNEKIAHST